MAIKPFVKWAGGKGCIAVQLNSMLPLDFDSQEDITYVEPFVGGGALLFTILQKHNNIKRVVINDINRDLIYTYRLIKENPGRLIKLTDVLQNAYLNKDCEGKKRMYYAERERYNKEDIDVIQRSALFLFLNHTCFNGLYRVNSKGLFNVPFGQYESPVICVEIPKQTDPLVPIST